ncbi:hypothetical protein PtB15_3B351 [Puccinia triticina]|nr:hypothetical protein PtB15_3B351 [Puccinia triticina]
MQFSVPIAVCLAFAHTSIARPFNPTLPSSSLGSPLGLPTPDYIINNPNLPIRPQPVPANNGPTPNDPLRFLNPNNLYGPPINNPSGIVSPAPNPYPYPQAYGNPALAYSYGRDNRFDGASDTFSAGPAGIFSDSSRNGAYDSQRGSGVLFQKEAKPQDDSKSKA